MEEEATGEGVEAAEDAHHLTHESVLDKTSPTQGLGGKRGRIWGTVGRQ